nr:MAG TPA: hypothetical protein [Caudoviricetes sp.]
MGKSVRIKAPEGKMVVSRVRKTIGRLVRTPKEDAHLYEIMDEAEAYALDREWHPEFYGLPPKESPKEPDPKPVPPSEGGVGGSGADFVDKVREKLDGVGK